MASSPDAPSAPATDDGLSRRSVLTRSAAGLGIVLSGSLTGLFGAETDTAHGDPGPGNGSGANQPAGYGPLVPDPAGLLALPAGFSYSIVARSGVTRLDTGEPTPSDPDGTASFVRKGGNGDVLINNHEVSGAEPFPVPHVAGFVY